MTSAIPRLRETLLDWYDREGRSLPWRIRPEDRSAGDVADPYAIWLSEIMLQQTTVPHATPYWHRFLALWPRVEDLAAAPRDDVLREWAGLGYYARARNLHACAVAVTEAHAGQFPDTMDGLRALPGIGDYTANAILAAAFDKPASVVDGNVERVITRLHRIATPMPRAKPEIRREAGAIADPQRSGDYAQAIMDLGATICTPRKPDCAACCWQFACAAAQVGDMEHYPVKAPKKAKPVRHGTAWLVRREGQIWLRRRAETGLLGGMTEVPSSDWIEAESGRLSLPFEAVWVPRGVVRHIFTHFELRLDVREVEVAADWEPETGYWAEERALDAEALPSVMRKVLGSRGQSGR